MSAILIEVVVETAEVSNVTAGDTYSYLCLIYQRASSNFVLLKSNRAKTTRAYLKIHSLQLRFSVLALSLSVKGSQSCRILINKR
jgi:hypothetical protein